MCIDREDYVVGPDSKSSDLPCFLVALERLFAAGNGLEELLRGNIAPGQAVGEVCPRFDLTRVNADD